MFFKFTAKEVEKSEKGYDDQTSVIIQTYNTCILPSW